MASIVVAAAGISNAVAAAAAGIAAAALDAYLVAQLFPPPDQHGQRLDDLEVGGGAEGKAIPVYLGSFMRGAGVVLYLSDLIEEENTTSVKGAGAEITTYTYRADALVAAGRGGTDGARKSISKVLRIYADGKALYVDPDAPDSGSFTVMGTDISASTYEACSGWTTDPDDETGGTVIFVTCDVWINYDSVSINFYELGARPGMEVTVSGFSDTRLNGTRQITVCNESPGTHVQVYWGQYRKYAAGGPPVPGNVPTAGEAAGNTITGTVAAPTTDSDTVTNIAFYTGTDTQDPVSWLEGHDDINVGTGYRGTALAQITGLNLTRFGNRVPSFSFELESDASPYTRATALGETLEDFGFASSEYETTNVSGNLDGALRRGPTNGEEFVTALLLAYDIIPQEYGGVLYLSDWSNLTTTAITADDLGAHEYGSDIPRQVKYLKTRDDSLPTEVEVNHYDTTKGLERGSQSDRFRAVTGRRNENKLKVNLPLACTPSYARLVARRMRLISEVGQIKCEAQLPPSYLTLVPNDLVSFTVDGEDWLFRLDSVERGVNGLVLVRGTREETAAHNPNAGADDATYDPPTIDFPVAMYPYIMDIAPMREADATVPGYYYGASLLDPNSLFSGGTWYESRDQGTNYDPVAPLQAELVSGWATTTLAAGVTNVWDEDSTVQVDFIHGVPATKTRLQVEQGANWFLIDNEGGGEIVGIATWTNISGTVYEGSTMLRGLRNTETAVDDHTTNEKVALVTPSPGAHFGALALSDFGNNYRYKATENGYDLDDSPSAQNTHQLGTVRPFGPYDILGSRDASNNLTVTWRPRSRSLVGLWTDAEIPLHEDTESYEFDAMSGATVVRTIEGDSTRTFTYTAAQQTSDGLTPGDPVEFNAYQISSRGIGRGNVTNVTV